VGSFQIEYVDVTKRSLSGAAELLKINHYKAPRDKLICILNCSKVIFGLIRHLGGGEDADTFLPILIFIVLKAKPENLISNVEYINRFRSPERLSSESGYYLSSLVSRPGYRKVFDCS
jgi:Rab5 GDP/GTP exchange factor